MIATETVSSSLADLREMPLTEMAALSAGTVEETLRRILPGMPAPVAPPKFNSTI
jgi:FXSXX-COOH protein